MADLSAPRRCVLHLVPTLGLGGAERQLSYLCPALPPLGWETHVGYLAGGPNLDALRAAGLPLHPLEARSPYDPRLVLRVAELIGRVRPALLQTWLPLMDVVGGCAALWRGVPWIVSERTLPPAYPPLPKLLLRNALVRAASAVVSNSSGADAWWAPRLSRRVLRRVIRNGLPLRSIQQAAPADLSAFGLPNDQPVVAAVGRFDAGKNVETLFEALARVARSGRAVAILCGGGPLLESTRRRIADEGLSQRMAAPGYVTSVSQILRRADVALSLSRFEGMPNVVMEAAAAGCALVVSDIPAHREILSPAAAWFVSSESAEQAAAAVLECLSAEPEVRERVVRSLALADAWSIEAAAGAYASVYDELLVPAGKSATANPSP
jgi:glycosyltransferase involved in cell wall biosynthesis